jgi:hypothetical protein
MLALGVPGDATRRSEYPHPFPQKENDAKNKAKHMGQLEWL